MRYLVRRPESILDKYFSDFSSGELGLGSHLDIYKDGNNYVLTLEMPGFAKDEIILDYKDDILSIEATHKEESNEENEKEYVYRSRSFKNVSRKIRFNDIDVDNIDASYNDGVLKIVLPKTIEEEVVTKRIELK